MPGPTPSQPGGPYGFASPWLGADSSTPSNPTYPQVVGSRSVSATAITSDAMALPAGSVATQVAVVVVVQVGQQAINSTTLASATQRIRDVQSVLTLTVYTKVLDATDISTNNIQVTFAASQRHTVTVLVANNLADFDVISTANRSIAGVTSSTIDAATPSNNAALILDIVAGYVNVAGLDVSWLFPDGYTREVNAFGPGAVQRSYTAIGSKVVIGGAAVAVGPDVATASQAVQATSVRLVLRGAGAITYNTVGVGVVGDSLTDAIETTLPAFFVVQGWNPANVYVDGLIGRFLVNGGAPTSQTMIDTIRATIGDPRDWVLPLLTNDVLNGVQANWPTSFATLLAKIDEQPNPHRIYFLTGVGDDTVGFGSPWVGGVPVPRTFADMNTLLYSVAAARTDTFVLPWGEYAVANGDASWWQHDANRVHMTPYGYAIRRAFIAQYVAIDSPSPVNRESWGMLVA